MGIQVVDIIIITVLVLLEITMDLQVIIITPVAAS